MIHLRFAIYGVVLGFSLSRIGFTNYDELHAMFVFADLRMFLTFVAGVCICFVGYLVLHRRSSKPRLRVHRGTVPGGLLFGAGWAVCGACPGAALAQVGEGQLAAIVTVAGIVLGAWLYPRIHRRVFRWDVGSCEM